MTINPFDLTPDFDDLLKENEKIDLKIINLPKPEDYHPSQILLLINNPDQAKVVFKKNNFEPVFMNNKFINFESFLNFLTFFPRHTIFLNNISFASFSESEISFRTVSLFLKSKNEPSLFDFYLMHLRFKISQYIEQIQSQSQIISISDLPELFDSKWLFFQPISPLFEFSLHPDGFLISKTKINNISKNYEIPQQLFPHFLKTISIIKQYF